MCMQQSFYPKDDEVDLFELLGHLYKQKTVIILCTVIAGLIAIFIALYLPKIYSTRAIISKSGSGQFQKLNTEIVKISDAVNPVNPIIAVNRDKTLIEQLIITPDKAFYLFEQQLTSQRVLRQAFEASLLAQQSTTEVERSLAFDTFSKNLNVVLNNKTNTPRLIITYKSQDAELAAHIINEQMIKVAHENVVKSLEFNQYSLINASITKLQAEIQSLEVAFRANNQIETTLLNEAFAQAEAVGITSLSESVISLSEGSTYLRGTTLLRSRIDQVKKRETTYRFYSDNSSSETDQPYISGVASKVHMINQLRKLRPTLDSLQVVNIEEEALIPIIPVKPKKSLIVALGIILGGMLGIFIALIRIAIFNRKRNQYAMKKDIAEEQLTLA